MVAVSTAIAPPPRTRSPRVIAPDKNRGDTIFDRATMICGLVVLVLLTFVGVFLLLQSRDAFEVTGWGFFTTEEWRTDIDPPSIGVLGLLTGTLITATIAVVLALPMGIGAALFITEYASQRGRKYLTAFVDLLAAIPALLFGLWGFFYLTDQIIPLAEWLTNTFGWVPFLSTEPDARLTGSMFIAGIVVAFMVLPIITSVVREVFAQTPAGEKEAALALGGTRLGMIRTVVLPYGRGGIIGGTMLGLGRALGETIAVVLLLPQVPEITFNILENGGATISGFITHRAGTTEFGTSGLMAAGLVLFFLTLGTNMIASVIVSRSRSGAGVEL